jgi:hypothetical protein
MDEWEAREEAAREEYEREVGERTLAEIKENSINAYFFYYGDDIEQRIQTRIHAAKELIRSGFFGESLTSAIIAVELTIRWFLLRPLCEAAFISEEVADILVERILPPRTTSADREILPKILEQWGSNVTSLKLRDGADLWEKLKTEYIPSRNRFVHRGEPVEEEVPFGAVDAAERLLAEAIRIVQPFKRRDKDGWAPKHCRRKLDEM